MCGSLNELLRIWIISYIDLNPSLNKINILYINFIEGKPQGSWA